MPPTESQKQESDPKRSRFKCYRIEGMRRFMGAYPEVIHQDIEEPEQDLVVKPQENKKPGMLKIRRRLILICVTARIFVDRTQQKVT